MQPSSAKLKADVDTKGASYGLSTLYPNEAYRSMCQVAIKFSSNYELFALDQSFVDRKQYKWVRNNAIQRDVKCDRDG